MAPKKRARGAEIPALQWVAPDEMPSVMGLNAEIWLRHKANVEKVLGNEVFEDIGNQQPLGISDGDEECGSQAVFRFDDAEKALSKTGQYMCGINLCWVNVYYTASTGVPIMWSSVEELRANYFAKPGGFAKVPIEVGVTKKEVDSKDFGAPGTWKRISSEEVVMAFFAAVAADIDAKKGKGVLKAWYKHMLTVPAIFYQVNGDLAWFMEQRREDSAVNATVARTTVQRIFDVNNRRSQLGPRTTAQQVYQLYNANLKTSERSERISVSFVEKAFQVWDKALCKPTIQTVVLAQEEFRERSLFAHSTKLSLIVSKAKTPDNIEFVFQLLHDYFQAGLLNADTMGTQALEGKAPGSHGKGLIDVWTFKRMMKNYLLDEVMASRNLASACKASIREACHDFGTFRKKVGFKNATEMPDLTWRAGWPKSAELMLGLIEDIVFSTVHEEALRMAVRASKSAEDACDIGSIKEALDALDEAINTEEKAGKKTEAAAKKPDAENIDDAKEKSENKLPPSAADVMIEKVKSAKGTVSEQEMDILKEKELAIKRIFEANVSLVEIPKSEKKVMEAVNASAAGKLRVAEGQFVGVFVDPGSLGETITAPHVRLPPVNTVAVKALIRGFMKTRENGDAIHPRDMYFVFDNGVANHAQQVLKCITTDAGEQIDDKETKKIYITVDEDSLRARKGCVRQGVSFDQVEVMTVVTSADLAKTLPMAARKHFSGTNLGNKIGDVVLPDVSTMWQMKCKEKNSVHGAYRVAVGGKTKGEEDVGRGVKRKTPDTLEPTFWHARPIKLMDELLCSYNLAAVVDFTPGDGTLLSLSVKRRVPYIGFGLSEAHVEHLKRRCLSGLMESSIIEGEDLYDPKIAVLMKGVVKPPTPGKPKKPTAVAKNADENKGEVKKGKDDPGSGKDPLGEFKKKLAELKKKKEDEDLQEEQGGGGGEEE